MGLLTKSAKKMVGGKYFKQTLSWYLAKIHFGVKVSSYMKNILIHVRERAYRETYRIKVERAMKSMKHKMMAGTVAAALLIAGLGGAITHPVYADDDSSDSGTVVTAPVNTSIPLSKRVNLELNLIIVKASGILDMDYDDLNEALKGGKSLASVSVEQGKSAEDLMNKLTDDTLSLINNALSSNQITQAEADTLNKKATEQIRKIVNEAGYQVKEHTDKAKQPLKLQQSLKAEDIAAALGVTKQELNEELNNGKSLSEIALDKGMTDEQLINKLKDVLTPSLQSLIVQKK